MSRPPPDEPSSPNHHLRVHIPLLLFPMSSRSGANSHLYCEGGPKFVIFSPAGPPPEPFTPQCGGPSKVELH